jgi:hypothetical protein
MNPDLRPTHLIAQGLVEVFLLCPLDRCSVGCRQGIRTHRQLNRHKGACHIPHTQPAAEARCTVQALVACADCTNTLSGLSAGASQPPGKTTSSTFSSSSCHHSAQPPCCPAVVVHTHPIKTPLKAPNCSPAVREGQVSRPSTHSLPCRVCCCSQFACSSWFRVQHAAHELQGNASEHGCYHGLSSAEGSCCCGILLLWCCML